MFTHYKTTALRKGAEEGSNTSQYCIVKTERHPSNMVQGVKYIIGHIKITLNKIL